MIIPIKCFTCSQILGNKWNIYTAEMNEINSNTSLSKDDKTNKQIELFEKLNCKRYCCRNILMTTVDMTDIIN